MSIYMQAIEDPGNREKFVKLYEYYRAYMLKRANMILNNTFDAEDALHNAFVSISRHIDKIQEIPSMAAQGFVTTVIDRKAIDLYRQRHHFVSLEAIEKEIDIPVLPPADDDLARCLSKLSPRYQHVIILKYYHGYTTKEIADIFKMNSSAVSKLNQRAKAKLEKICREEGCL